MIGHGWSRSERAVFVGVMASMLMLATATVVTVTSEPPFDPFAYSPIPRPVERLVSSDELDGEGVAVVPLIEGVDGPAVRLGGTVPTTGKICSSAAEPVDALGNLWWQRVGSSIRFHVVEDFPAVIQPGCTSLAFENEIPDDVADVVADVGASVWTISGDTRPTAANGVAATFQVESFTIVP